MRLRIVDTTAAGRRRSFSPRSLKATCETGMPVMQVFNFDLEVGRDMHMYVCRLREREVTLTLCVV